ncbi:MAG: metalloregulator ArsR/SmtB family transcription factor [Methylovulum sp.]|uniref:ArsR/SmtB family transcription factor n=1 Tax=Methylovulum sp. TaxID=1916980 RepID=UPI0026321F06|nr:metalloregulator ArsR/SmtB family transcription factor [Methylovulum sp.]MDD2722620.1 metalloregulator ArsR/SmtB family transcription factor [Methylovulum sp.]MDD5123782.1 metalloregulator ArsR/SmtB family transcription factor [Methylovulum sp.]
MELVSLYKCLCDVQRLRILNLLKEGPLCVCHIQEILGETQVKISKQLQYMKKLGIVWVRREGVWMVYSLPVPVHPVLLANLHCLQARSDEFPCFAEDLQTRSTILQRYTDNLAECPQVVYQSATGR